MEWEFTFLWLKEKEICFHQRNCVFLRDSIITYNSAAVATEALKKMKVLSFTAEETRSTESTWETLKNFAR